MFCAQCGKKLMNDMRFCPYCGAQVAITAKTNKFADSYQYPLQEKIFKFSIFCNNKKAIKQINEWLSENYITIKSIKIEPVLKQHGLKIRTGLARVVIQYINASDGSSFRMGFFEAVKRIGRDDEKVEKPFYKWKADNPEKQVLWKKIAGYCCDGGTVTTLFYLYSCY